MANISKKRITKSDVDALALGSILWDDKVAGFGVRRQKGPKPTYFVKYRTKDKKQRWQTIGRHGSPWTVDAARNKASIILGEVAQGLDPAAPAAEPDPVTPAMTVRSLCLLYQAENEAHKILNKHGAPKKPDTVAGDHGRIHRHIIPLLGDRVAADLLPEDIANFMFAVRDGASACVEKTKKQGLARVTGGSTAATRTVGLLGGIFAFAVRGGRVKVNPCRDVTRLADKKKARRLSPTEYDLAARALKTMEQNGVWLPGRKGIEFLLKSGWRSGEVGDLTWAALSQYSDTADLKDSKTGASVRPVNDEMAAIINELEKVWSSGPYVFPSAKSGKPLKLEVYWNTFRKASGLPKDVTPHVLRHSFASEAAELKIDRGLIGACIGHKGKHNMTEGYIHRAEPDVVHASNATAKRITEKMYPVAAYRLKEASNRIGVSA